MNRYFLHDSTSETSFTYWADLESTKLNDLLEEVPTQWVHALPLGNYKHPIHGMLNFTPERIRRFADSVKQKVRGIDPDIDYDHKLDPSKGKAAAGWVKDAEERADGLWLLVEWTKDAAKELKDKKYRYFSTEFADTLEDNTGNVFQDVVLGGGLTNRPFMKNLTPINLSEVVGNDAQEGTMDRAELARILGLSEDATEDDVKAKLNEVAKPKKGDSTKFSVKEEDGKLVVEHPDIEGSLTHELPKVEQKEKEGEKELAKLAEDNPAIKMLMEQNKTLSDSVKTLEASNRLSEVSTQLSEVGKDAGVVLPPVVQTKLRAVMAQLPKHLSDDVAGAMQELVKVGGPVKLGEQLGKQKEGKQEASTDDVTKFLAEVDKVQQEDDKLEYREALAKVQREHPQLWEGYQIARDQGISLTEES